MDRCITPKCGKTPYARGLCNTCYQRVLYKVRLQKVTWKRLENEGVVLKPVRPRSAKPLVPLPV